MDRILPVEHLADVVRKPVMVLDGQRYFVVAHAWTPDELKMIDNDDAAIGYALIRIDAKTGKGLPREYTPLPTLY